MQICIQVCGFVSNFRIWITQVTTAIKLLRSILLGLITKPTKERLPLDTYRALVDRRGHSSSKLLHRRQCSNPPGISLAQAPSQNGWSAHRCNNNSGVSNSWYGWSTCKTSTECFQVDGLCRVQYSITHGSRRCIQSATVLRYQKKRCEKWSSTPVRHYNYYCPLQTIHVRWPFWSLRFCPLPPKFTKYTQNCSVNLTLSSPKNNPKHVPLGYKLWMIPKELSATTARQTTIKSRDNSFSTLLTMKHCFLRHEIRQHPAV